MLSRRGASLGQSLRSPGGGPGGLAVTPGQLGALTQGPHTGSLDAGRPPRRAGQLGGRNSRVTGGSQRGRTGGPQGACGDAPGLAAWSEDTRPQPARSPRLPASPSSVAAPPRGEAPRHCTSIRPTRPGRLYVSTRSHHLSPELTGASAHRVWEVDRYCTF